MIAAEGILTARGGVSSHAALVARQMGKVCVCGAAALQVDYRAKTLTVGGHTFNEGDYLSIDGTTGAVYVGLGAFHYVFRKRFLELSIDPTGVAARGISVRFWDFLFYASFGLVVTRSVAIAGVLLVFCYLIVPSVGAMLWASRIGPRLAIGWGMGVVVSILGMYLSVQLDLPTGAAIVCTFGLVLIAMALLRPLIVTHAVS